MGGEFTFLMDLDKGQCTELIALEKCLSSIRLRDELKNETIKRLQEENDRLKEPLYHDCEIKRLQNTIDSLRDKQKNGFYFSFEESVEIERWKHEHEQKAHGGIKPFRAGAIGGSFEYIFNPTGIGVIGKVRCICGDEHVFRDLT